MNQTPGSPRDTLAPKQQRFVEEYCIDFNGTRALIAAGYSKKTAGAAASRMLRIVNVKAEIEKRRAMMSQEAQIKAEEVIVELKNIALARATDKLKHSHKLSALDKLARHVNFYREKDAAPKIDPLPPAILQLIASKPVPEKREIEPLWPVAGSAGSKASLWLPATAQSRKRPS